jgi:hypothetical protein
MQRPTRGECGCRLRFGRPQPARPRAFVGEAHGTAPVWMCRSCGEAERQRFRWVLCHECHDAVTTPIPVASATAFMTQTFLWFLLGPIKRSHAATRFYTVAHLLRSVRTLLPQVRHVRFENGDDNVIEFAFPWKVEALPPKPWLLIPHARSADVVPGQLMRCRL